MAKIALITGANKGLGLETARQLGAKGIIVLAAARGQEKAARAAAQLQSEGFDAHPLVMDVSDKASVDAAAAEVEKEFGRLDILINNAGVALDFGASSLTVSEDVVRKTFETNFFGPLRVTQAFLPLLRKGTDARIVNLSSILGSVTLAADPTTDYSKFRGMAYQTSKSALNMMTVAMGGEGAMLEIPDGAATSVALALLDAEGPTCGYFHKGKPLPW